MRLIHKRLLQTYQFFQTGKFMFNKHQAIRHEENRNYPSAINYWRCCIKTQTYKPSFESLIGLARCLQHSGQFEDAEAQYLFIYRAYPDNTDVIEALCKLYDIKQDSVSLNKFSKIFIEKDTRQIMKPHMDWLYIKSLISLHQYEKARNYFLSNIDSYEHVPVNINKMVTMASSLKLIDRIDVNWEELIKKHSDNIPLHNAYVNYFITLGDYDTLKIYGNSIVKTTSYFMPLYRCYMATYQYRKAREYLQKSNLADREPLQYYITLANNYLHCCDNKGLIKVFDDLLPQEISHPHSIELKILMIRILIQLNAIKEATSRIEKLSSWLTGRQDVSELMAWRANMSGQHQRAKEININLLKNHYFASVHAPIFISQVDKRKMMHGDNDILLVSPMKNCIDTLPWFLDYYRKLGVDYFFIIDNDSEDGTSEYLLNQPDVYLFHSSDSFDKSNSGMRWINYIIKEYVGNAWCLYIDSDEALVFPGMERSSLRNLVDYMDRQGYEVLPAFMLDMYPKDLQTLNSCNDMTDRIEHSVYFDNDYQFFNTPYCPYKIVKGGIRNRLFGMLEMLEKVPMVRAGKGIYYTNSHAVTSAKCSDVTAILLHYNISFNPQLLDSNWISEKDSYIKSRMPWCKKRYSLYSDINSALDSDYTYLNDKSVLYESSEQLVQLGLMHKPDTYLN